MDWVRRREGSGLGEEEPSLSTPTVKRGRRPALRSRRRQRTAAVRPEKAEHRVVPYLAG